MSRGKMRVEWSQHSHLLAMIYNTNVAKKSDGKRASEFDPFTPQSFAPLSLLKDLFVKDSQEPTK